MKFLYLQFLRLRVWMLRRRLRRMGFRAAADRTHAHTLLHLKMDRAQRPNRVLRWIEIGLLIVGFALWLIFYLRIAGPIPPQAKPLPNTIKAQPHHESRHYAL